MRKFNNIHDIKAERSSMKDDKIIYNLLTVLLGELDRLPTRDNPSEDQIYSVIKNMYNNAMEMKDLKRESAIEAFYLKDFIKKQLNDDDLEKIIIGFKNLGMDNIGSIMKALNTNYKGQFDGKKASEIIKKML
jgi:uncharacterized protein YqeY